jgi:hypothetical protein
MHLSAHKDNGTVDLGRPTIWADLATADISRVEGLVEHAVAAPPHTPLAQYTKGQMLCALGGIACKMPGELLLGRIVGVERTAAPM